MLQMPPTQAAAGPIAGASPATSSRESRPEVPQGGGMPWPAIVLGGIGLGALAARGGLRALRASGVKMNFNLPSFSGMAGGLQGFESPMTRAEAKKDSEHWFSRSQQRHRARSASEVADCQPPRQGRFNLHRLKNQRGKGSYVGQEIHLSRGAAPAPDRKTVALPAE
mmetsp:Transcript_38324/g.82677  ORF Transcript_38324/g.82677 Transcript_38324/m.82677 type:complete len:167 (+) Transcript_38324:36-536(+)